MSQSPCSPGMPCSFAQFVVSLGHSALVNLGEVLPPEGKAAQKDLGLAQQTIQVLELLRTKTRGNLDADESRLLDALLADLNTRYSAATA